MGLLDEAIREHLELQRRSGADPSEVARKEREALGPVVRGEEQSAAPADEPLAPEPTPAPEPEIEPEVALAHDAEVAEAPVEPQESVAAAPAEPPPAIEHAPPAAHAGEETAEFDVEADHEHADHEHADHEHADHEPAASEEGERDEHGDLLEETPEFLQETPEHDRLWFEQGPPQKFDFDK